MSKIVDITGQRFGRLRVLKPIEQRYRRYYWLCQCDCGQETTVDGIKLRNGNTRSCGCFRNETTVSRTLTHGHSKRKGWTQEYRSWTKIFQRCYNPKCKNFHDYGGRGITVCERWLQFENFIADMGNKPTPKHSLDRINNDGNYEPGNCRWATHTEQMRNRRPFKKRLRGKPAQP